MGDNARSVTKSAASKTQWRKAEMLQALEEGTKDEKIITIMNLLGHQRPTIGEALQLYRAGIYNEDADTRNIACLRLIQIGASLVTPELEEILQLSIDLPNELIPKLLLLGHFSRRIGISPEARPEHHKVVLWLISNYPSLDYRAALTPPYALTDGKEHCEIKQLWLGKVKNDVKDPLTLHNAAGFFLFSDSEMAKGLNQKAKELEPQNPRWTLELALFYMLRMGRSTGDERVAWAAKALAEFDELLSLSSDSANCYMHLPRIAMAALEAGEIEKARKYASDIFTQKPVDENHSSVPAEFSEGYLVLGRLAMIAGNKEEAKEYLRKAGEAFCGKRMRKPNMVLAKELLAAGERGEREAVIDFVRVLAEKWAHPYHLADRWLHSLKEGKDPDFRAYPEY